MANEDKATRFQRLRRRATVAAVFSCGLVLGLAWMAGPPAWARVSASAGSLAQLGSLTVGALGLLLLCAAATFPATFFRDAVLTRRYGLLRERPLAWIVDWSRHAGVNVVAGTVAVAAFAVLRWLMEDAWWAIGGIAVAAAPFAAGRLLRAATRVESRGTPLVREALRERLTRLLGKAGFPGLGLFQVHVGERTRVASAAIVNAGRARYVAISDTLLADHTDEEVEVVVAHELAHVAHHDVVIAQAALAVHLAASLLGAEIAVRWAGPIQGVMESARLPLALLTTGALFLLLRPLSLALSRLQERRADRYALTLTGNGPALTSVLRRLAANNLVEPAPSGFTVWWFHSHPAAAERMSGSGPVDLTDGGGAAR